MLIQINGYLRIRVWFYLLTFITKDGGLTSEYGLCLQMFRFFQFFKSTFLYLQEKLLPPHVILLFLLKK